MPSSGLYSVLFWVGLASTIYKKTEKTMTNKTKIAICSILSTVIIGLLFFSISSCQTAPKAKNYKLDECYIALDCMYRINTDKDKAVCAPLIEACRDALKEKRFIDRAKFCRDYKPAGMSENECRLWLNQR